METFLPLAVLRQIDLELGEPRHYDASDFLLGRVAVAGNRLLHRARREGLDLEPLALADGHVFVRKDIQERSVAIPGEESFLDHENCWSKILDEAQDDFPSGLQSLVWRPFFPDHLYPMVDKLAVFKKGDAHFPRPRINREYP